MAPLLLVLWLAACQGEGTDTASPTAPLDSGGDSGTDCQAAIELCDGVDQDCDGEADEGLPLTTWYLDADEDGHGDDAATISDCHDAPPEGHVSAGGDCDDTDPTVHPGAAEVCDDGVWNGCVADPSCRLGGLVDLAEADLVIAGEAEGDLAGRSAVWTGDLDGDGFDDLLLDAQESDVAGPESGSTYLFSGPLTAGSASLADAPTRLRGDDALTWSARSISGLGDTDGDGRGDVVVGVIRDATAGYRAGGVYVIPGPLPSGELALADVDAAHLVSEGELEAAGSWVRGAGDVNADGLADVLVGAMYSDRAGLNNGAVYVLHGPVTADGALVDHAAAIYDGEPLRDNDWAGRTLDGVGDIDGDGYDDFVVGADGNDRGGDSAGAAYLVLGPVSGVANLVAADTIWTGEVSEHRLGGAVAGAGDTDGDGRPEILLGAFGHSQEEKEAGAFYLVDGTERGIVDIAAHEPFRYSDFPGDWFGYYVDGVGDADGDGFDDVIVGAPRHDGGGPDSGAAFLFYGPLTGTDLANTADLFLAGAGEYDYAGYSCAGAGDLDGDGRPDLLIGSYGSDLGGEESGAFQVVFSTGR